MVGPESTGEGLDAMTSRSPLNRADQQDVGRMRLGRYPFEAAAMNYMGRRHGTVAPTTETEEKRKYRYLGNVFEKLKRLGKVETTDPRHMGRKEMQEFMAWMRENHIDTSTQEKYIQLVNNLLESFKNHIVQEMKSDGVRFPRAGKKPIRTIDKLDLDQIFDTANDMTGWQGSVARGIISLYFGTGVRPSELRLAEADDLKIKKMSLYVRHPKGEGSWASPQEVAIIRGDMVPIIERYLIERTEWLKKHGIAQAKPLFPSFGKNNKGDFYTANGFRQIKTKVEALSGVDFKLKDFRSTLTSITVNGDLSRLPAMSAQLRHSNLATTQKSYFAMERGVAGKQLRDAWKEHPVGIDAQNTAINGIKDFAGYV